MSTPKDLAAYFDEAASWDADRAVQADRMLRISWYVGIAGWVCAVASAIAIVVLTPLKTVTPYVIRVDNTTGLVDVVPEYTGTSQVPQTVTRYLLRHYVDVCERFNWASAESDYEECGAFNSARRNQAWATSWATSNPTSPLNVFKDGTALLIRIVSVSFFERASGTVDLAQVRYIKVKRSQEGVDQQSTHWIATLQYTYSEPSGDPRVRQWNPIGFRILDFRSEPEIEPAAPALPGRSGR